jgi:apolipoprotein D and lipocalin family protein
VIIGCPVKITIQEPMMNRIKMTFFFLIVLSFHQVILFGNDPLNIKNLKTVDRVDLDRYIGLWYEIAKIPNPFQKMCTGNTTARYTLRKDGRIDVQNRCMKKDGTFTEANGIAKVVDKRSNAKLKVSFVRLLGLSLFWGDYWIIGLDEDYRYAIVGEPARKYGWILSRTPEFSPEQWEAANQILRDRGYDPKTFIKTRQDSLHSP